MAGKTSWRHQLVKVWICFFKDHSQPSHSPWTPWNKQEINNNLQCTNMVLSVLCCLQFQKVGSCFFLNLFRKTIRHLPQTVCVTTKHFERVILNDNYANNGKISSNISWGFVLKGRRLPKFSKLAWIFFITPFFNYELPRKAKEMDAKNRQVVPQELFLQRQPTDLI